MHFDGRLITFQHFHLIVQLFLPLLLDRFKRILIKVPGLPQPVELTLLFILLYFPSMQDNKSVLIFGVELFQDLALFGCDLNIPHHFLEHAFN